jgi:polysaccharide biosynthesis/export protein
MIRRIIKLNILTVLFLFSISTYLSAQDTLTRSLHTPGERYSSEETRQHYQQGKDFYSKGRYIDARNEFEKAIESSSPPRLVTEKVTPQQKTLDIMPPAKLDGSKVKLVEKKKDEKIKPVKGALASSAATLEVKEESQVVREYHIDVGDVLDISVWQILDLSKPEVIVRPDGKISFPLIGDIEAEGLTLTQLDDIITEELKTYVKDPEVSIMLRRFGESTNKVSILGEVSSPGVYRYSGPPSLAEVIASAGGYTKYSVINSVMVIRYTGEGKKPEVIRINLAHILKGNKYSNNIWLKPNDVIYVPRSLIGNLTTFTELIQPAISEYMQTMDARRFHNIMHRNAN